MNRSNVSAFTLAICSALALAPCSGSPLMNPRAQASGITLLWERNIGYKDDPPTLVFVSPGVVAVGQTVDKESTNFSERTGEIELLESDTGSQDGVVPWRAPSASPRSSSYALVPLHDDRFLLRSWDTLKIVSSRGEILKTRTLAIESTHAGYNPKIVLWDRWDLASGPEGRTVLATRHNRQIAEAHWLSNQTLEDLQVESFESKQCCRTVGDDQVVYSDLPKDPTLIRKKGMQPRFLCGKCMGGDGVFVDAEHIFLAIPREGRFLIVSTTGDVLSDEKLPGRDTRIYGMSVAPVSRQVALFVGPKYFANSPATFSLYIYDVALKKLMNALQIPEERNRVDLPSVHFESSVSLRFALSPNGKRLAILSGTTLRMYSINP